MDAMKPVKGVAHEFLLGPGAMILEPFLKNARILTQIILPWCQKSWL